MMIEKAWDVFAGASALVLAGVWATPASAQSAQVAQKPPMYTYVSNWSIPRAQWTELDKELADTNKVFAGGALLGYGVSETVLHQAEGGTHAVWWSAMSMAALFKLLENLHKTTAPVLNTATKHWDDIYVSRFYNWHSGASHGAYSQTTSYKLAAGAPVDAVEMLSKNIFVPLLEKLLSDGTLIEYEVDIQAEHTEAPNAFWITFITAKADGLDRANASIEETFNTNPLVGPAFFSVVDFAAHRDYLFRTEATFK
jgi:hypothetical protein